MTIDWDAAVTHALTLPGAAVEPQYGKPAVKINGHTFLFAGLLEDSFALVLDPGTVDLLVETDPETYWRHPRYKSWPGVLARYESDDPERVLRTIERAYEQAKSRKPKRRT